MRKLSAIILIHIGLTSLVIGQNFCSGNWIRNGTVRDDTVTDNCYIMQITADCFDTAPYEVVAGQVGSMWCDQTIDICNDDFEYCWDITTGSDGQTGDGFTFTLQSSGTAAIGGANANIGYGGITGNVFAVEFDPYDNAGATDDGPCAATGAMGAIGTIGFQYDNSFEHDGSYTDSEGFPHSEVDADQYTCITNSDYGWNVTNSNCTRCDQAPSGAVTFRACFNFDATTEMFTVSVDGTNVLGPSKVDLAVILGTCDVYYGLTTSCGGQTTHNESCEVVTTLALDNANFEAEYTSENVSVTWNHEVDDENIGYFSVQRSNDELQWKTIGEVDALDYIQENQGYHYQFIDSDVDFSSKYYRFIQYNLDRKIDLYSTIAEVDFPQYYSLFTFVQNGNNAELLFSNKLETDIDMKIFTTQGKLIKMEHFSDREHLLSINGLAPGIYVVSTTSSNNLPTFNKIVIN